MLTKRVRRLLGVAAVAPLLLSSCDNNPFDPFDNALGTYELSVFAGRSMPGAEFDCAPGECDAVPNGGHIRINSGSLTLYNDGTFVETNNWTETPTGGSSDDVTFTSAGTFDLNGEDLELSDPARQRFVQATLEFTSRVRINYIENGDSFEYIRD
ncbi:MAG: hypothetical protein WD802_11810 [Gemmatimonadaceae bacterium]